jgi:hypothetical protein
MDYGFNPHLHRCVECYEPFVTCIESENLCYSCLKKNLIGASLNRAWSVLCPDCDHGVRGGESCQTCKGIGTVIVIFRDDLRVVCRKIESVMNSDATPFDSHNNTTTCLWCNEKWNAPDWRLDPQPPLFGHPTNECLVWDGIGVFLDPR